MTEHAVALAAPDTRIEGDLAVPSGALGLVVFAHGSGSSRRSPRNRAVASGLRDAGIATLLIDLLTPGEERVDQRSGELRFNIELLASRLTGAVDSIPDTEPGTGAGSSLAELPVGLFGASTGAAAALVAAAARPERVQAVVSRGGRPDLAADVLARVAVPVLLVVGGADSQVGELNARAARRLSRAEVRTIPGAGHLFEEPGALEEVTRLAATWFRRWLA